MVDLSKPSEIENYDQYSVDGITVYVKKDVVLQLPVLTFRLEKVFFIKHIVVDGVKT